MPKVKAIVECFIDNSLRKEGEVFDYNGPANQCVEAIDETQQQEEPQPETRRPGRPRKTSVV